MSIDSSADNEILFPCKGYSVTLTEARVISQYHKDYDPKLIEIMLNSEWNMSSGMRCFIADVVMGRIKRPNGQRSSTHDRDLKIHTEMLRLWQPNYTAAEKAFNERLIKAMTEVGLEAAPSPIRKMNKECAADEVSKRFGMNGDCEAAVIKAFDRIEKLEKERREAVMALIALFQE